MGTSSADIPLPWERVLWDARPGPLVRRARGDRYILTDLRLVVVARGRVRELALGDIGEVSRSQSRVERMFGVATLDVRARRGTPVALVGIRRATHVAALLELLSGDPRANADPDALTA
ncbi:MAG TPA: PH domain-containing protein, partial [Vicinamibacterales bacterium]|nr:PH domain-containing protein [Vicinamibacterales bacterium]